MGAHEDAFTALDAQFLVPNGNLLRDIAFFPLGCSCGKCSIDRHRTDRKGIALPGDDRAQYVADKGGSPLWHRGQNSQTARRLLRNVHTIQMSKSVVDGSEVLFDHGFAALPIGVADRVFDSLDCFFAREDTANSEEASLHDGVDATGHARFPRDLVGIDDIELQPLFDDVFVAQVLADGSRPLSVRTEH